MTMSPQKPAAHRITTSDCAGLPHRSGVRTRVVDQPKPPKAGDNHAITGVVFRAGGTAA
jgi:hypothetical protein